MSIVTVSGFRAVNASSLRVRGIVLDLDGVLVDSRDCWIEAERLAVTRLGGQWISRTSGSGIQAESSTGLTSLALRSGLRGFEKELAQAVDSAIEAIITRNACSMPGVWTALKRMISAVPVAVATNSSRRLANLMLKTTGLVGFIDVLACSDDVELLKPAPQIYALACERLGLSASDCVGIDDTPEGIHSAIDAGLATLALGRKAGTHPGIAGIVNRLDELTLEASCPTLVQPVGNMLPALVTSTRSRRDSDLRH